MSTVKGIGNQGYKELLVKERKKLSEELELATTGQAFKSGVGRLLSLVFLLG